MGRKRVQWSRFGVLRASAVHFEKLLDGPHGRTTGLTAALPGLERGRGRSKGYPAVQVFAPRQRRRVCTVKYVAAAGGVDRLDFKGGEMPGMIFRLTHLPATGRAAGDDRRLRVVVA